MVATFQSADQVFSRKKENKKDTSNNTRDLQYNSNLQQKTNGRRDDKKQNNENMILISLKILHGPTFQWGRIRKCWIIIGSVFFSFFHFCLSNLPIKFHNALCKRKILFLCKGVGWERPSQGRAQPTGKQPKVKQSAKNGKLLLIMMSSERSGRTTTREAIRMHLLGHDDINVFTISRHQVAHTWTRRRRKKMICLLLAYFLLYKK